MGKVMDNVGFSTKKQDLQNTTKRKLTEDEKMALRQDLGLYGEYPQVMMSGEFTGFVRTPQGYQANYTDLSKFPDKVQDFFNNTLLQLVISSVNEGKDFPIYEVDCDGEKRVYTIFYMQVILGEKERGIKVYLGVAGGNMDYALPDEEPGADICAAYSFITGSGAFAGLRITTPMPGTAHQITLTDVTPGRVNQIPSKYLPQSSEESLIIPLEELTINDDRALGTISSENWRKINASTKMPKLYQTNDDGITTWYNVIEKTADAVCAVMYQDGKLVPLDCVYND